MTVGRKGHGQRVEDLDDDNVSENSDSSAPSTIPPAGELPAPRYVDNSQEQQRTSGDSAKQFKLPSFDTFLRDTFHHRSTSMPGSWSRDESPGEFKEPHAYTSGRQARTLSGTWIRDTPSIEARLQPRPDLLSANPYGPKPLPTPQQSPCMDMLLPVPHSRVVTPRQQYKF